MDNMNKLTRLAGRLEGYADAEDLQPRERADLLEAAARLRGEAQAEQAVVWQRRKVGGTWETCTAIEHTNYPQPGYEYRTNRPQPTAVAGDVERALAAKWRNKADSLQFSGTWAGDYVARFVRDCADELEAALSSTAAPEPVAGEADAMCPNCVTPWKCNGPHEESGAVAKLPAKWRERAPVGDYSRGAAATMACLTELEAALAQDRASHAAPAPVAGDAVVGVTRAEAESFLAQYHAEVWAAAESDEPIVAYDDAGKQLAKAFLARFDATSFIEVTDEMVERACAEWWGSDWGTWAGYQAEMKRAKARRTLHAALRTGGGTPGIPIHQQEHEARS